MHRSGIISLDTTFEVTLAGVFFSIVFGSREMVVILSIEIERLKFLHDCVVFSLVERGLEDEYGLF